MGVRHFERTDVERGSNRSIWPSRDAHRAGSQKAEHNFLLEALVLEITKDIVVSSVSKMKSQRDCERAHLPPPINENPKKITVYK